jgi:hypothetical protein
MLRKHEIGSFTPARSDMQEVLQDRRVWTGVGVVVKRPNDDAHYEIVKDSAGNPVDVLVEVDFMPNAEPVYARLGALSGGAGAGIWSIPPVGTEVVLALPGGELDGMPCIVGRLSSRNIPGALDADTLVIINPKKVIIASQNDKVYLGSQDGTGCQPAAVADDLDTRLQTIESRLNDLAGHTHAAGTYAVPGPTSVTGVSGPSTNAAITSPPSIKSTTTMVKK